jgi:type VI secretion system protein VasD
MIFLLAPNHQRLALRLVVFVFLCMTSSAWSASELEPTSLELTFMASDTINLDEQRRPKPIEVCLYELKSSQIFDASDFFSLQSRDKEVLGTDLLKKDCFILRPGDRRKISRKSDAETTSIGVLASYRELEKFVWRATYKLPEAPPASWYRSAMPANKSVLSIQVGGYGLRIKETN